MAQLEIPDGFGNLQLFWSVAEGDQLASTAIGVELTPDSLNESDVADTAQDVVSQFAPSMTTEDRWVGWKLTFTAGSTLLAIEGPLDSPGTSVQDPVLPTAAVLARKRTLGVGRAFRGRMFLPRPLRIDCNTDGTLISGGISDWQDACDAAFNALLSSPWVQIGRAHV